MTAFERPAPDIDKIVAAWRLWDGRAEADVEEVLPGRTMADLKIGGIDRVLATLSLDNDELEPVEALWHSWERGKTGPDETLAALTEAGFGDIVEQLADVA